MRAQEFVLEYKLLISRDADGVAIKATAGGKNLGHAEFFFDKEGRLDPQTVWVDERYHGQGIAADMYDYLKDNGYTIVRSWDQTDAGKGFWDKHRGEDVRVWEARAGGKLNRKYESGRHELYRWITNHNIVSEDMWGVSMTMLPKLGINPQKGTSEDTPKGIYFYPLWYIWSWINSGKGLPWGNDFPYIQLFQYDNSHELKQQTKIDPAQVKQALSQYCPKEIIEQTEYNGDAYWFIYNCLVSMGKGDETTIIRWNKVLRDLGFTSVMDNGSGWIATNEPAQGIILDPRIIKQVKTFENYTRQERKREHGGMYEEAVAENFADGKNPGRKGLAKRSGVNTKASVSSLRKTAKNSSGEKQRMAHWLANMKAGRAKAKRK
jgi:hypothetical protein